MYNELTIHDWVAHNCDQCLRCPPVPVKTDGCCQLRDAINRLWWERRPLAAHIEERIGQGAVCRERHCA